MKKKEIRNFDYEIRIESREDQPLIIGHGAIFDTLSENLGGFREKIDKNAFDEVLNNDVRALINHNSEKILGRTKSGTLQLSVDEKGLKYEIDPADTTYARDLLESIKRGDISQSSFSFSVEKDSWGEDSEGNYIRTILKIARLYDVSPVTFPAYLDTDVAKRNLDEYVDSKEKGKNIEQEKEENEKMRAKRLNQLRKLQAKKIN